MRAYWSRFEAFFEENHIKKDDKLKVDDAKATESDKQCRYGIGSELVLFLHMAHRGLPVKLASILSTKLKHNNVASLKDIILEKAQDVLEELERSEAHVNRMHHKPHQARPQYNRDPHHSQQGTSIAMMTTELTDQENTHSPFDWNKDYFADDQQDLTSVRNIKFTYQDQGETNSPFDWNKDYFAEDPDTERGHYSEDGQISTTVRNMEFIE